MSPMGVGPRGRVRVELKEADLARWIQRPFRRQRQDPRDVLLAAMTDFGDAAYDDPQQFEAFLDSVNQESTLVRRRACTNASRACLLEIKRHTRDYSRNTIISNCSGKSQEWRLI